jgi:hypothetical protein
MVPWLVLFGRIALPGTKSSLTTQGGPHLGRTRVRGARMKVSLATLALSVRPETQACFTSRDDGPAAAAAITPP